MVERAASMGMNCVEAVVRLKTMFEELAVRRVDGEVEARVEMVRVRRVR